MSDTASPAAADPGSSTPSAEAHPAAPEGSGNAAAAASSQPGNSASDASQAPQLEPEYLAGIEATGHALTVYQRIGAAYKASGIEPKVGNAALSWLHSARQRGGPPASIEVKHSYSFGRHHFEPEDQPYLIEFGNAMAAAGATQEHVDAMLNLYSRAQVGLARERAAMGRAVEVARKEYATEIWAEVRTLGEEEYATNRRLLVDYLKGLTPEEREATDSLPMAELVARARATGSAAQMSREEIERVIREDRGRYNRDLHMQVRLRDLLREQTRGTKRAGEPAPTREAEVPSDRAKLEAEISEIEQLMRTNRTAYNKDEKKQARLRQLYAARGGSA